MFEDYNAIARWMPELNPVENIWQYLRANWLSNRVFEDYNAIAMLDAKLGTSSSHRPETITSNRNAKMGLHPGVNVKCRTEWALAKGKGAGLVMPWCESAHLNDPESAHAVLIARLAENRPRRSYLTPKLANITAIARGAGMRDNWS